MLTVENVVGNQDDWANVITNVDMGETPFLDWLPPGPPVRNVSKRYQADKYTAPRINSHVDGQPWTSFKAAGDNRGALRSLVQWFDNTTSVSKLSEDATQAAGVADELARDIPKRLKEMGRDMETNFMDEHDCREDDKVNGYLSRSVGSWIASSAQSLYPVPSGFLTPAASIKTYGAGEPGMVENDVLGVLGSQWDQIKSPEPVTGFMGRSAKLAFNNFPLFIPSSASTGATGVVYYKEGSAIDRTVNRYTTDYGTLDLVLTPWIDAFQVTTNTSRLQRWAVRLLHRSRWALSWNQKPKVYKPEFKGGSYEAAMDAIAMLVCWNPQAEGRMDAAN